MRGGEMIILEWAVLVRSSVGGIFAAFVCAGYSEAVEVQSAEASE
jgi:hypothetical protein